MQSKDAKSSCTIKIKIRAGREPGQVRAEEKQSGGLFLSELPKPPMQDGRFASKAAKPSCLNHIECGMSFELFKECPESCFLCSSPKNLRA